MHTLIKEWKYLIITMISSYFEAANLTVLISVELEVSVDVESVSRVLATTKLQIQNQNQNQSQNQNRSHCVQTAAFATHVEKYYSWKEMLKNLLS